MTNELRDLIEKMNAAGRRGDWAEYHRLARIRFEGTTTTPAPPQTQAPHGWRPSFYRQ